MSVDTSKLQSQARDEASSKSLGGSLSSGFGIIGEAFGDLMSGEMFSSDKSPASSSDILSGSANASSMANSFKDAGSMFSSPNANTSSLSSIAPDIEKGLKETQSKLESLATDAAEAITAPIAFVTKQVNEVMEGLDSLISDITKPLQMFDEAISNISKAVGTAISSIGDLTTAISNVTNNLAAAIASFSIVGVIADTVNNVTSFVSDIASTVTGVVNGVTGAITGVVNGVTGAITGVINGVTGAITGVVNSVTGVVTGVINGVTGVITGVVNSVTGVVSGVVNGITGVIGGVVEGVTGLVGAFINPFVEAFNILPEALKNLVDLTGLKDIGDVVNDIIQEKLSFITDLGKVFEGLIDIDTIFEVIMGIANPSGDYSGVIDELGNSLSDLFGSNSKEVIDKLYELGEQVCPTIEKPNVLDNYDTKKMYDALLALSVKLDVSDLLDKLTGCEQSTSNLSDDNSLAIIRDGSSTAAMNGSISMYSSILDNVGAHNIKDPVIDAISLAANMPGGEDNVNAYVDVLAKMDLTPIDLISSDVEGHQVIDTNVMTVMSIKNTDIVDTMMSKEDQTLIHTLMLV